MPKVTFILRDGTQKTVEFESGKLPYQEHGLPESFLDVAMNHGIPLEHACGGSCACTTCHLIIKEGEQHLSAFVFPDSFCPRRSSRPRWNTNRWSSYSQTFWIPARSSCHRAERGRGSFVSAEALMRSSVRCGTDVG